LNLNETRPTLNHIIQVLNQTMNLLRGVRVNAALTIQLFSQLFHYISMWLFNKLIRDQRSGLCSRYWGDKLTRRLSKIQLWSEKQGLELAADCHLQRIMQAAFFLQASKYDVGNDLSKISSVCYGLNSLQIKCLLKNYLQAPNEPPLSAELCNQLLLIAVNTQDRLLSLDGKQIQLEEEADLQLPFLLPEDGHSSEMIKGLPTGLLEFLEHLQNAGHCWLWQNTQGPGSWKKFMTSKSTTTTTAAATATTSVDSAPPLVITPTSASVPVPIVVSSQVDSRQPTQMVAQVKTPALQTQISNEKPQLAATATSTAASAASGPAIVKFKLNKKNNGLGLSIVAARGTNQMHQGIYIKSVVPGGASDDDGRLNAGDQL
jgi:afadin